MKLSKFLLIVFFFCYTTKGVAQKKGYLYLFKNLKINLNNSYQDINRKLLLNRINLKKVGYTYFVGHKKSTVYSIDYSTPRNKVYFIFRKNRLVKFYYEYTTEDNKISFDENVFFKKIIFKNPALLKDFSYYSKKNKIIQRISNETYQIDEGIVTNINRYIYTESFEEDDTIYKAVSYTHLTLPDD